MALLGGTAGYYGNAGGAACGNWGWGWGWWWIVIIFIIFILFIPFWWGGWGGYGPRAGNIYSWGY